MLDQDVRSAAEIRQRIARLERHITRLDNLIFNWMENPGKKLSSYPTRLSVAMEKAIARKRELQWVLGT